MPLKCQVIFILFGINSFIYHFPKLDNIFYRRFYNKDSRFSSQLLFYFCMRSKPFVKICMAQQCTHLKTSGSTLDCCKETSLPWKDVGQIHTRARTHSNGEKKEKQKRNYQKKKKRSRHCISGLFCLKK